MCEFLLITCGLLVRDVLLLSPFLITQVGIGPERIDCELGYGRDRDILIHILYLSLLSKRPIMFLALQHRTQVTVISLE